jgi:predicted permease
MAAWQDLRHTSRNLRSQWLSSVAVISILAVGIGATTAVFSVVDRVLFRPLPYANAERLVSIGIRISWLEYDFLTTASYLNFRRNPGPVTAITSWSGVSECDWTGDRPARSRCARVEATFLPVLGVAPVLGRNFTADEDQPGVPRVALISHALWKSRFGASAAALGKRVELDGQPAQIVGVLPPDFRLPTLDRADLLLPEALPPNPPPGAPPLRIYGRLRDGFSAAQARDAILAHAQELFSEIPPDVRKQIQFHVLGIRDVQMSQYRPASWALLAAVLAMLWMTCANAANLLLARSIARRRDIAIRVALGATRTRLAGQALFEGLLVGLAGGLAGCALAFVLLRLFVTMAPAGIPPLAIRGAP